MSYLSPIAALSWPEAVLSAGALFVGGALLFGTFSTFVQMHRARIVARQEGELRQLVRRYESLAENSLDAQQRVAADLAELRSRTGTIEQILRTVE